MKKFLSLIITSRKLKFKNIFFILIYKLFLKTNTYKIFSKIKSCPIPEKLSEGLKNKDKKVKFLKNKNLKNISNLILEGKFYYFFHNYYKLGLPPNWFFDPFSNKSLLNGGKEHWTIFDKSQSIDIKNIWELSRWYWAPILARAWKKSYDKKYLIAFEKISEDWCKNNPVNSFPNWSCGQEVSIRLLHIFQAWYIFNYPKNIPILNNSRKKFVKAHIKRITLTKIYAEAQCNNHWISEASALFVGGLWLRDKKIEKIGRNSLEKSIDKLILSDGTFSQYSLTYHRLLIDTIVQVELWRRRFKSTNFSNSFRNKIINSIIWLSSFIDKKSGDGPNLGGNDGAYCYQLKNWEYRNFKPTIKLAKELFKISSKINSNKKLIKDKSKINFSSNIKTFHSNNKIKINYFPDGGFIKIISKNDNTWALFRLPKFIYRPSNIDPLHFDFWADGKNFLRDGGSYSYNLPINEMDYFQGIESHNTIQFGNNQPMPRLTRFLFGNWVKQDNSPLIFINKNLIEISSSYSCEYGKHKRKISKFNKSNNWIIEDTISKFNKEATLRWNLIPIDWKLVDKTLSSRFLTIEIKSNVYIKKIILKDKFNSTFYNQKSKNPVLEIKVNNSPAIIKTLINFKNANK